MTNCERDAVKAIWRKADAVCFDVDSTVMVNEGIDDLASFLDKGPEVSKLTKEAMDGSMTFRVTLAKRLDILKPSRAQVEEFNKTHPPQFSPRLCDLIKLLQGKGVDVYLVSGGFRQIILPAAKILNIPEDRIYANLFQFNEAGEFISFDESQPTSAAGGKPKVAQLLKDTKGYQSLVFIGDGATDLEASPPADAFIGYGGNVIRDKVKAGAHWFVTDFQELIDECQQ